MSYKDWSVTANRYVAYLDILGFKNMVLENTHQGILGKLKVISDYQKYLTDKSNVSKIRVITFSDSVFIFSKDDSEESLRRFIIVVNYMLCKCIHFEIPIKGAASYGEITVDFENSLFFGKPLISAYELHDEILMYAVIADGALEKRIDELLTEEYDDNLTLDHETPLKQGKAFNLLFNWPHVYELSAKYNKKKLDDALFDLGYLSSGINKRYVDNTQDFVDWSRRATKTENSKEPIKEIKINHSKSSRRNSPNN